MDWLSREGRGEGSSLWIVVLQHPYDLVFAHRQFVFSLSVIVKLDLGECQMKRHSVSAGWLERVGGGGSAGDEWTA